jgi:hypothetical protein
MLPVSVLETNKGQVEGLPKNPRFIRDARYEKLKKSIADAPEMLHLRELIVFPLGEKYVIVGGNMRYRACCDLGHTEVSCKVLPEDTPVEKLREYAIKDNNEFGQNDYDLLANEWDESELEEWGVEEPYESNENADDYGTEFSLPDGDKSGIETVNLMMSKEQAAKFKQALKDVQMLEEFKYIETFGNSNQNGNAAYLMATQWEDARK